MKDIEDGVTGEDVTATEVLKAMNNLSPNLKFTIERSRDFPEGWIPTLDFEIKYDNENKRILYKYYQKPMQTKWPIPPYSAFEPNQLKQILANDLVRRMARMHPAIRKEVRIDSTQPIQRITEMVRLEKT